MKRLIPIIMITVVSLTSCKVSNKQIIRQQHLEEGVESPTTVEELKETLFPQLVDSLTNLDLDKSLEYFRNHNYLLNKRVRVLVNNQTFIGEVVGIDNSFCLQIATHDMLLHVDSGEIEIL